MLSLGAQAFRNIQLESDADDEYYMLCHSNTNTTTGANDEHRSSSGGGDNKDEEAQGPNDVLLGRGPISYNHPGNRFFRLIVAEHVNDFMQATNQMEKSALIRQVITSILNKGGRFLKQDGDSKL